MVQKGKETNGSPGKNDFYRMKRDDLQFTTGGKGIAHSEQNESNDWVHFLQIWAIPWARGLTPRYHTRTFPSELKRKDFIPLISPLAAGPHATAAEESAALPAIKDTIPIHADLIMGAGIIPVGKQFKWTVGGGKEGAVRKNEGRRVYLLVPMTKGGAAKVRVDGREGCVLGEGDGAFVEGVRVGDLLGVESLGEAEAEVVVLDSD